MARGKLNRYGISPSQALLWADTYEASRTYLAKINSEKEGRERRAQYIYFYCRHVGLNPDELIRLKMNSDPAHYVDAERLLDGFCVDCRVDMPESAKWNISNTVRGLYTKNYHRLEQSGKIEYSTVNSQHAPSKEERFLLYRCAYTPRDRIIVLIPNCSAIALETLSQLRFSMFEADWIKQEIPCIMIPGKFLKGHDKGRYRGTWQVTFLTPECKRELVAYREWYSRTFGYVWQRDSFVFLDVDGGVGRGLSRRGISAVVGALQKRSGVAFGTHDGRRVVQTALEDVNCSNNWIKKIKGRKVSGEEAPYSKPKVEQLRCKYREALGELEFLGEGYTDGKVLSEEDWKKINVVFEAIRAGKMKFVE